jgi:hypothetical protein
MFNDGSNQRKDLDATMKNNKYIIAKTKGFRRPRKNAAKTPDHFAST